jgi:hypothetical protein
MPTYVVKLIDATLVTPTTKASYVSADKTSSSVGSVLQLDDSAFGDTVSCRSIETVNVL